MIDLYYYISIQNLFYLFWIIYIIILIIFLIIKYKKYKYLFKYFIFHYSFINKI